jgi:hypothetical protein
LYARQRFRNNPCGSVGIWHPSTQRSARLFDAVRSWASQSDVAFACRRRTVRRRVQVCRNQSTRPFFTLSVEYAMIRNASAG